MKKYSFPIIVTIIIFVASLLSQSAREPYYALTDKLDLIEVIDSNKLTLEDLSNRNGKLIIERVVGIVTDVEKGDGEVLYGDPYYNYISYKDVPDISNGNIICSYFIYNPDTNYEDDILMRFDYIIE